MRIIKVLIIKYTYRYTYIHTARYIVFKLFKSRQDILIAVTQLTLHIFVTNVQNFLITLLVVDYLPTN